jgi:glycerol-3-phosphate cytidylyltransferase
MRLERQFAEVGVEVVYFPYSQSTSSSRLRQTLKNIDAMALKAIRRSDSGIPAAA